MKQILLAITFIALFASFACAGEGLSVWEKFAAAQLANDDLIAGTDVDDTTQSTEGSSKAVTAAQIKAYVLDGLDADAVDDTSTTNKFVTATDVTNLGNLSGTNTGDQDISGKLDKSGGAMTGTLEFGVASTTTGLMQIYNSSKVYPVGLWSLGADAPSISFRLPGTWPSVDSLWVVGTGGYISYLDPATFTDDQNAGEVAFTPAGTIEAITVQAAIEEVASEAGGGGAINDLTDVDTTGKATGKILVFDASGNLVVGDDQIGAEGTGDITGVTAGTGLSGGGDSGAVTLNLADTAVSAAAYTNADITIDAQGRITAAANGTDNTGTDDQTIDVLSLAGTTLSISLEDDGEVSQTVDLAGLQDGTGTDDQTASEVTYSNASSGMTAITTQAAIDEVEARVDTNDAKVSYTPATPGILGGSDPAAGYFTDIYANNYYSSADDGAKYISLVNTVAITAAATTPGFLAYLTDRFVVSNGTDWTTRYLLDSSFIGSTSGHVAAGDHNHSGVYASVLGADDNYVTDAQLTVITNTSGTNTGDQIINAKYISGTEVDFYGTLLDPAAIYAVNATNHAVTLINKTPAAFTITEINISCDADPTTEITMTFQHKAAGVGYGTPTTIEAITTAAGVATITTGIDDATIPIDTKVFVTLSDPDAALNECAWQIEGDWD